ncbi:hypothetical protein BDC45DRAFT_342269 [Circinella umbellata]|nr:hypothetical protein BDC45DRAFT_342269 [Circinella umbellata]
MFWKVVKKSFEVKKVCLGLLNKAITKENEGIMNLADVVYRLAPRFLAWEQQRVVEGTFINSHLADLLDVIFGDHELLTYEWTNKRMANVSLTFANMEDESNKENLPVKQERQQQCNKNKNKNDDSPMIPDYVSSVLDKHGDLLNVFVVEVKAPDRNQGSNDYFKVGEEMKQMVSVLSGLGVENGRVCGLLMEGWQCTAYMMFLKYEGVYPYIKIGEFSLIPSKEKICDLKYGVEVLQLIKSIILNTAELIEQSDLILTRSPLTRPSFKPGFD